MIAFATPRAIASAYRAGERLKVDLDGPSRRQNGIWVLLMMEMHSKRN